MRINAGTLALPRPRHVQDGDGVPFQPSEQIRDQGVAGFGVQLQGVAGLARFLDEPLSIQRPSLDRSSTQDQRAIAALDIPPGALKIIL